MLNEIKSEATNKSALDIQISGDHYKKFKIQPVTFIQENNLSYMQGNVIKYITRYKDKNGKEDLEKVKHYVDLLIEHEYPEDIKGNDKPYKMTDDFSVKREPYYDYEVRKINAVYAKGAKVRCKRSGKVSSCNYYVEFYQNLVRAIEELGGQ